MLLLTAAKVGPSSGASIARQLPQAIFVANAHDKSDSHPSSVFFASVRFGFSVQDKLQAQQPFLLLLAAVVTTSNSLSLLGKAGQV